MDQAEIIKGLDALADPEKWKAYKIEKIQAVAGKLHVEECERFADYMNEKVIAVIKANDGAKMYIGWKDKSKEEKKQFAQRIVDAFMDSIILDIWADRVTIYTNDGSIYKKPCTSNAESDEYFDRIWKEDITAKPEIVVTDTSQGLMGITPTKKFFINFDLWLYKSLVAFLMDLRHELDHVVNIFFPNIHPLSLNNHDRLTALRYYVSPEIDPELYKKNPIEITADMKRTEFAEMCSLAVTGKHWNEPQQVINKSDDFVR